jgi:hypothetical protein
MSERDWRWDPSRGKHYYFSKGKNAYIFDDGSKIALAGPSSASDSASKER